MTYFYHQTWTSQDDRSVSDETRKLWEHVSNKTNWRIVQLPNGYYQAEYNKDDKWVDTTRRETLQGAEAAIDSSIEHYKKKLSFANGPVVVKTFDK
tara:strand:+ start:564 stop:851 length:288 start_codon:yes stop_codon:yes gene_type:complete